MSTKLNKTCGKSGGETCGGGGGGGGGGLTPCNH